MFFEDPKQLLILRTDIMMKPNASIDYFRYNFKMLKFPDCNTFFLEKNSIKSYNYIKVFSIPSYTYKL